MDPKINDAIAAYPKSIRKALMALRELILETARETPGVGELTEDLRWGQPSFITKATGSGSTIRIDGQRDNPEKVAVFFHCQTGLVDQFRAIYDGQLAFVGNRAIEFDVGEIIPVAELKHCIALALTHHLRKKTKKKRALKSA